MPCRSVVAAVVFAASCLPALAQARTSTIAIMGQGCPVSFTARREGALVARAGLDGRTPPAAALLNVHFAPASVSRIYSVKGTVLGTTAAPHLERANGDIIDTAGPRERTQSFQLTGFDAQATTLDWQLNVSMPLIKAISLSEIQLANGTTWHESATSHCRVEVSGFLPVNATVSPSGALSPR